MNNSSIADEIIPTQFFLSQNYPNPFNEKTAIKYCVPLKTKVHIAIYNTHGEMIRVLVNEIKNPGTYEVEFATCHSSESDDSERNLPDGYYFYKMITEEFSSEKKWFCINHLFGKINMKMLLQFLT